MAMLFAFFTLFQAACEPSPHANFGEVTGYAWTDANQNGSMDSTETLLDHVQVSLYSDSGQLVGTTTTNQYGSYSFPGLQNGSYYIQFTIPKDYQLVAHQGTIAVDPTTGKSGNFTISDSTKVIVLGVGMKLPSESSSQGTVSDQPVQQSVSLTPSADTVASQYNPTGNFGTEDKLWLQNDSQVYLRFPLDQLPKDYTLVSAFLDLFIHNSSNSKDALAAISFPDQNSFWLEGTLTWDNKPAQAPNAPTFFPQLADNNGQGSKDSFNVTDLFQVYLHTYPDAKYFDIMLSYYQGEYIAQEYYSREGILPPELKLSYSYHP